MSIQDCEHVQKKILENSLDESSKKHIKECRDCADFANFADDVLKLSSEKTRLIAPTEKLDVLIKGHAYNTLRVKRPRQSFFIRQKPFLTVAIAASLLIISAVLFFFSFFEERTFTHPEKSVEKLANKRSNLSKTQWDESDSIDEYFELSVNLIFCKETINRSALDEDREALEKQIEIEVLTELLI